MGLDHGYTKESSRDDQKKISHVRTIIILSYVLVIGGTPKSKAARAKHENY